MKTVEAKFRIVTPMFIGGADQTPSDGIRPPSVKGALRFWWRALNWGKFRKDTKDDVSALRDLHKEEARLFGAAAKTEKGRVTRGQGCFLLEVIHQPDLKRFVDNWPQAHTRNGVKSKSGYLGLGLFQMNEHQQRQAIEEGAEFTLRLLFRPDTDKKDMEEIRKALVALGLFGGLGSRSRRGFGSVALVNLDGKDSGSTLSIAEYKKDIGAFLSQILKSSDLPPFTAFSQQIKVGHGNAGNPARQVHSNAGSRYLNHRRGPGSLRGDAKRWFGLPLEGTSTPDKRRSSPLFFHIHPIGKQFVCLNLFLPAKFLPEEATKPDDYANVISFFDELEVTS